MADCAAIAEYKLSLPHFVLFQVINCLSICIHSTQACSISEPPSDHKTRLNLVKTCDEAFAIFGPISCPPRDHDVVIRKSGFMSKYTTANQAKL